jgi:hypothetical protein
MFGSEIASAFVRIRPNMSGFKSETEAGVRGAFSKLATIAGVALGAGAAFEFGKGAVEAAAGIQKQVEVIRSEFGGAGNDLVRFADTTGTSLGAANAATDAASARFGLLFNNLGIGTKTAAQMTKGFEELALSVNAIRGGGASGAEQLLQSIVLAAAGNTRGLKQLGISVDGTSEKIAAFKLGLIQTTSQALTPAQKAQAIYAIATAHLSDYLQQAKAHSGDFANVQARLSAEWQKAKETLGAALLPELTKVVRALAGWLDKMERSGRLQRDFNEAGHIAVTVIKGTVGAVRLGVDAWDKFSGALGGAKQVAVDFLAVMAVAKIRAIASAITTDLVNNGFAQLKIATQEEKAAYLEAFGTMEIATVGLSATIKSALISTGIGALVVAVGLAVGYIVTHWTTVKRYTEATAAAVGAAFHGMGEVVIGIGKTIGGALIEYLTFPLKEFLDMASSVAGWIPFVGGKISAAARAVDSFSHVWGVGLAKTGAAEVAKGFGDIGSGASKAFTDSLNKSANDPTQQASARDSGKKIGKSFADGVTSAVGAGIKNSGKVISDTLQTTIDAARQRIQSTIQQAKNNLDTIGGDLAKTLEQIQQQLGGAAGAVAGSPQGQAFAKLKKLIESGAPTFEIQRAQQELSSQLENAGKSQATVLKTQLANLTDEFNRGKITYRQFETRLHHLLREEGGSYQRALKAGGTAFGDQFRAQVRALAQQAKAIAALPAKYRDVGGGGGAADLKIIKPLQVIREENLKIATAAARQRAAQLKATEKTNATLAQIHGTQVASIIPPGHGKKPRGRGSHHARKAALAGGRP